MDTPQEQQRAIVLPADPPPIINARPEDFDNASNDYRVTSPPQFDPVTGIQMPNTTFRVTEDAQNRVTQPFGVPSDIGERSGYDQNAVMPLTGTLKFGVALPVISVIADGTTTVRVSCYAVHNLQLNVNNTGQLAMVAVQGLSNLAANGFYSVDILTATAFSYSTYGQIAPGPLLTSTTLFTTALVGLPRGFEEIPKIYGPGALGYPPPSRYNILLQDNVYFLQLQDGTTLFELEVGP